MAIENDVYLQWNKPMIVCSVVLISFVYVTIATVFMIPHILIYVNSHVKRHTPKPVRCIFKCCRHIRLYL